ncbi:MAG: type I secretion system permease/ATPase [Rhodocyclaceae bacterium]|nr:type I secretion system permease/ATPase [Rhodocyclaceae bacterium]
MTDTLAPALPSPQSAAPEVPRNVTAQPLAVALAAFRREFVVVGILSLVVNVLMLVPTLYMLQVYDRVMISQSILTLLGLTFITAFLYGVTALSDITRSRLIVRMGVRLDEVLNRTVFRSTFSRQLRKVGNNPTQAFADLTNIRQYITGPGIFAFFDAPWTPVYVGVMFLLHPWLGITSLVFITIQAVLAWLNHRFTTDANESALDEERELNAFLFTKMRNAEVIESMGMVDSLRRRWWDRQVDSLRAAMHSNDMQHRMLALTKGLQYSKASASLAVGAWLVIRGELSMGSMIAANVLMGRASQPFEMLVGGWRGLTSARLAWERLNTLLLENPEPAGRMSGTRPTGQITLRGLVATAPGRAEPILRGLDIEFPAGQLIGIFGPSGSGKSTLAKCLVGIWPDTQGEVLLDGVPLSQWDRSAIGPHLGYLPQDVELFLGTLAENIARFGDMDSEAVVAAAQTTGVHDMILRLPRGYDNPIGEAGSSLSGGQRQRVALARAIYRSPALIVLDEPNANLDEMGEQALEATLRKLREEGSTVFLITHRPGILRVADQLVLMDNGRIRAAGPRDTVLAQLQTPANAPPGAASPGAVSPGVGNARRPDSPATPGDTPDPSR